MTTRQIENTVVPLGCAYDYAVIAGVFLPGSDERALYENLMLARLKTAVENAGFRMVEAEKELA